MSQDKYNQTLTDPDYCFVYTQLLNPGQPRLPVEAEPVEAEPVEAEPVEAEPVEAEPVKAEPVKAIIISFLPAHQFLPSRLLLYSA
mgnify:CR=1 FL=1